MTEMWKLREFTKERARLNEHVKDAQDSVKRLVSEFETFPVAEMHKHDEHMSFSTNCPHCKIHAYHRGPALHKCAQCRRYYYVNITE